MHFNLTDEQQMLADSVGRWIDKEYGFEARTALVAAGQGGSVANWRVFAAQGWLMAGVPEDQGGLGGSAVETAIIARQLGRGPVVEPWLGSAVLAVQVLLAAARQCQLREWLPSLLDGSHRLALAYSEPESRGLVHLVTTRARPDGDGWRVTGRKSLVLGAPGADAYIVSARTAGAPDSRQGIGLFLVAAGEGEVAFTPVRLHDGSLAAEIEFDDAPARLLGDAGEGIGPLEYGLAHAITTLCAELVGAMEKSLELTAEYLRTRQQFGVKLASFQSLQHRMADMAAEMELARSMLFVALASLENDDAATRRATLSSAKALVVSAARNVCGQAIQLHGGIGMTEECAIGHYFKRAVVADALFGNRNVHEAVCAAALATELGGAATASSTVPRRAVKAG